MNELWNAIATKLYETKQSRKYYEEQEKELLESLKQISDNLPTKNGKFELKMIKRMGIIQYSKIPELRKINLEQYRTEPIISWTLSEIPTLPKGE
jgi:hypothetical protein